MWHAFENLKIFMSSLMSAWQKTSLNNVRKNLTPRQWENLQIRKVFLRVSLRMGPNDVRESSIWRRECDGKVPPVCPETPFWMRICSWRGGSVLVASSFSSLLSRTSEEFSVMPLSVIFEFLVIFKVCVTSSVYWSMMEGGYLEVCLKFETVS
jgi:hypothetical protein